MSAAIRTLEMWTAGWSLADLYVAALSIGLSSLVGVVVFRVAMLGEPR